MAAEVTRIIKGLEIFDRDGSGEIIDILVGAVDPSAGGGVAAPVGSLFCRDVSSSGTTGELYVKTGAADTAWDKVPAGGGGSAAEEGFIRGFVGKSGPGLEFPEYSSTNVITSDSTGSAGDGDNLEEAIGKLDAEIGADVTPQTRTNNQLTASDPIKDSVDDLDSAIGADADATGALKSTNYWALADTIMSVLAKLDYQIKSNADAITLGMSWRENVKALTESNTTNDWSNVANGTALSTLLPFDDDDSASLVLGDFADQDAVLYRDTSGTDRIYRIYDDGGTLRISQLAADIDPLAGGDTFLVKYDLADFNDSENSSIYTYNSTDLVKIGDVDWALATGINLSSGFTGTTNGTPAANDTVEAAIGKLNANQVDSTTLSGVSQGATDLGTFPGVCIPDTSTIKGALQALEGCVEAITPVTTTTTGIGSTLVTVDSVLVDDVDVVIWHVYAEDITDRSKKYSARISGMHNGTPTADATGTPDQNENLFLEFSGNKITGITFVVNLSGAAGAQVMRLQASATQAGGMDVTIKRVTELDV